MTKAKKALNELWDLWKVGERVVLKDTGEAGVVSYVKSGYYVGFQMNSDGSIMEVEPDEIEHER